MSKWITTILPILGLFPLIPAHYRRMAVDNTDLCDEAFFHKPISIGTGALILELSKPRIAFHPSFHKSKLCEIHVKAPDGFGIIAYVEEAYLRKNKSSNECKDYIQFGQDDKIVFVTLQKSEPYCGHYNGRRDSNKGIYYDDPHGDLLVWINLFGRKETKNWPAIGFVNLTLVLTAYQAKCGTKQTTNALLHGVKPPGPGFRSCGMDPGPCISKNYFCDNRFNCMNQNKTSKSSEDEAYCQNEGAAAVDIETKETKEQQEEIVVDPNSLNTISWILIGICSALGFFLIIILSIGCTRNSFCSRRNNAFPDECSEHPPHHHLGLAELSAQPLQTEPNIYLPLNTFRDGNNVETSDVQVPVIATATVGLPEDPPPAYHTLFPEQTAATT